MAELEYPNFLNLPEGHMPEIRDVLLDLYRLSVIFLADEKLYQITHSSLVSEWMPGSWADDDPLWTLAAEYQWPEVTRILISSAIVGRIIDDRDGRILDSDNTVCGVLIPDTKQIDDEQKLSLRDAFNKIIHAERIRSDVAQNDEGEIIHLNPVVYFYGTNRGTEWKARLWVSDYVRQYVLHLSHA